MGPGKPGAKIENPGKLFIRLMKYVFKYYWVHCLIVVVGIIASVFATNQGTMFMQTLIDKYIVPLSKSSDPDFSKLLAKITEVGIFYGAGVIGVFLYNRLMIYVTQGTLKRLRIEMFNKMETLPIKYFDTHAHGDIMSLYTNDIDTLRQMISQSIYLYADTQCTAYYTHTCDGRCYTCSYKEAWRTKRFLLYGSAERYR